MPEVQVDHASAACLALAGTHDDLSALLYALGKLVGFGLCPFLYQSHSACLPPRIEV